jgi:hypothetical protein
VDRQRELLEGWFGKKFLFLIERGRKAKRIRRGEERLVEEEFDGRDEGFVNVGDGTTVAVEVQPWQTIGQVKGVVLLPRIRLSCSGDDDDSVVYYLSMAGKALRDERCVVDCGIKKHGTLGLGIRLRGGAGDGGATSAGLRDCYLNTYTVKKPDNVDPNLVKVAKFTNCTVSSEPLKLPCH